MTWTSRVAQIRQETLIEDQTEEDARAGREPAGGGR